MLAERPQLLHLSADFLLRGGPSSQQDRHTAVPHEWGSVLDLAGAQVLDGAVVRRFLEDLLVALAGLPVITSTALAPARVRAIFVAGDPSNGKTDKDRAERRVRRFGATPPKHADDRPFRTL